MLSDRVEETTTTQGTGAYALGGAPTGRRTFIAGIGAGNKAYAVATDGQADWELFEGTVSAGSPPTISRDTIMSSTNGGSAVNWGPGVKAVQCVSPAEAFGAIGNRLRYGVTTGSTGVYSLTIRPAPRTLIDGMMVWARANHSSPSAGSTLNVNGTGAKPIRLRDGTWAVATDDIVTNQVFGCIYDQSSDTWRLISGYGLDEVTMIRSFDSVAANFGPYIEGFRAANLANNMFCFGLRGSAQNTSGTKIASIGEFYLKCLSNTLGAESIIWQWETLQSGTKAVRGYMGLGFVMGTPTGGDKGAGTINASALYDDNVLLTCYPLALEARGALQLNDWDRWAHGRPYIRVREFIANAREWLDPKRFTKFWKERGHLPAMPSPDEWEAREQTIPVGELVQRLWETVDNLAVHIGRLTDRIEALEHASGRNPSNSDSRD